MNKKSLQTHKALSDHQEQGGRFDAKLTNMLLLCKNFYTDDLRINFLIYNAPN